MSLKALWNVNAQGLSPCGLDLLDTSLGGLPSRGGPPPISRGASHRTFQTTFKEPVCPYYSRGSGTKTLKSYPKTIPSATALQSRGPHRGWGGPPGSLRPPPGSGHIPREGEGPGCPARTPLWSLVLLTFSKTARSRNRLGKMGQDPAEGSSVREGRHSPTFFESG